MAEQQRHGGDEGRVVDVAAGHGGGRPAAELEKALERVAAGLHADVAVVLVPPLQPVLEQPGEVQQDEEGLVPDLELHGGGVLHVGVGGGAAGGDVGEFPPHVVHEAPGLFEFHVDGLREGIRLTACHLIALRDPPRDDRVRLAELVVRRVRLHPFLVVREPVVARARREAQDEGQVAVAAVDAEPEHGGRRVALRVEVRVAGADRLGRLAVDAHELRHVEGAAGCHPGLAEVARIALVEALQDEALEPFEDADEVVVRGDQPGGDGHPFLHGLERRLAEVQLARIEARRDLLQTNRQLQEPLREQGGMALDIRDPPQGRHGLGFPVELVLLRVKGGQDVLGAGAVLGEELERLGGREGGVELARGGFELGDAGGRAYALRVFGDGEFFEDGFPRGEERHALCVACGGDVEDVRLLSPKVAIVGGRRCELLLFRRRRSRGGQLVSSGDDFRTRCRLLLVDELLHQLLKTAETLRETRFRSGCHCGWGVGDDVLRDAFCVAAGAGDACEVGVVGEDAFDLATTAWFDGGFNDCFLLTMGFMGKTYIHDNCEFLFGVCVAWGLVRA